jgi:hypothetical protein
MRVHSETGPKLVAPFLSLLPITGAAISVFDQGRNPTVIHTSDLMAARLEELHFELGEGPMLDAFTSSAAVIVPDIADCDRWPVYLEQASALDAKALFVFPLMLGAVSIGAVLCYRNFPGALSDGDKEIGESLGRAIAGPAFRHAIIRAEEESPDDQSPIEIRREVHQATGMIVVQLDVSATDAFARLRAYAFSSGQTLNDVARDVIDRRFDFTRLEDRR